jgi:hypothetical protein
MRTEARSPPSASGAERGVPCQLEAFPDDLQVGPPSRREPWFWYLRRRARGARYRLRRSWLRLLGHSPALRSGQPDFPAPALAAGDVVRVRSADEIRQTLDARGYYRGCGFAVQMFQYAGQTHRVLRRVERFFDEKQFRMLKARNLVLLEGLHCDGSHLPDTQGCDRLCYFFWRTEWLEKLER